MQGGVFKTPTNDMEKVDFILNLKKLGGVESASGIYYRIDSVSDKYVIGTRLSTLKEFKIETDSLFSAYNDVLSGKIPMTTTALRGYVNHTQSPALAIIMTIRKL